MGCFSSLPEQLGKVTNPFDHPASERGVEQLAYRNYIGLINCRTQLICGRYMFIT